MMQEFLTRRQLAEYLTNLGLPLGKSQLDKIIWRGEGPPAVGRWGNRDVYRPAEAYDWAMRYLRPSPSAAKTEKEAAA
jgi:hypothetical protein